MLSNDSNCFTSRSFHQKKLRQFLCDHGANKRLRILRTILTPSHARNFIGALYISQVFRIGKSFTVLQPNFRRVRCQKNNSQYLLLEFRLKLHHRCFYFGTLQCFCSCSRQIMFFSFLVKQTC